MKPDFRCSLWLITMFLALQTWQATAQFVNLTTEIDIRLWSWSATPKEAHSIIKCVVGTNVWRMDGEFLQGAKSTCWFTGTNLVLIDDFPQPVAPMQRLLDVKSGTNGEASSFVQVATPSGQRWTKTLESVDGNPSRSSNVDLMMLKARIVWLAFCSGPAFRRPGHAIYPSSDVWKELICPPIVERSDLFEDGLGLPRRVDLYTTNSQPVLQYRTAATTNVLDWEFPLEFFVVQYRRARLPGSHQTGTSGWELHFTARGKVMEIGPVTALDAPPPEK